MRAKHFRNKAWNMLRTNYWMLFLATLIVTLVLGSGAFTIIIFIILGGPLTVGLNLMYLKSYRENTARMETVFSVFNKNFANYIAGYLLKNLFTFFWSLLFIIPGIIKTYSYAMTEYVLADNPEMDGIDAITKSRELMDGNKWRLFCLHFSFIGWILLSILTLGIGAFFLAPYIQATTTAFYLDLIGEKETLDNDTPKESSDEIEIVDLT